MGRLVQQAIKNQKAKVLSTFAFLASNSVNSLYQIFCLYLWANTNPIKDEYKTVSQLVVMVCLGLTLNIERAKKNKTKFFKNIIKKVVNKENTPSFVDYLVKSFLSCMEGGSSSQPFFAMIFPPSRP